MSEQVQKELSQLVKTQLEKKSSKKISDDSKSDESKQQAQRKNEVESQKQKMIRGRDRMEEGAKVAEEERWSMYRRLIIENAVRFFMILLYCVVAVIAIAKTGIIILTAFQHFLHEIFVMPEVVVPPKH